MPSENSVTLRKKLESLIVQELEKQLQNGEITGERASEIARIVLELVPENISQEQLLAVIPQLDDKASELAGVVYKILFERDETQKTQMIGKLQESMKAMVKDGN